MYFITRIIKHKGIQILQAKTTVNYYNKIKLKYKNIVIKSKTIEQKQLTLQTIVFCKLKKLKIKRRFYKTLKNI